jgi:hypothetical protein
VAAFLWLLCQYVRRFGGNFWEKHVETAFMDFNMPFFDGAFWRKHVETEKYEINMLILIGFFGESMLKPRNMKSTCLF